MSHRSLRYLPSRRDSALKATFNRAIVALAAITGTLCVLAAAGCGGGGDGSDSPAQTVSRGRLAVATNFPRPSNRSFRDLLQNMLQGPELAPSVSLLAPGQNRFGFALFDRGRRQIGDLDVVLYIAKGLDETAHGPFPARYEPIDVKPQFVSKTTSRNPDSARSVYVSQLTFRDDGTLPDECLRIAARLKASSPAELDAFSATVDERDFKTVAQQVRDGSRPAALPRSSP